MTTQKYLEKMKSIQEHLLSYLEDEVNIDSNFQNLHFLFTNMKIQNNKYEFTSFLHLLLNISNNHHRGPNFFIKIEQILKLYKSYIKSYFSNSEIFNIFRSNKRILLFLFEEKIIIMDRYIVKKITSKKYINANYPHYFSPEIKPFIKEKWFLKYHGNQINQYSQNDLLIEISKELPEDFYEKRKIGENDNKICKLIQKDSIEEFINHFTENNCKFNSTIESSIYETNPFLIKKQIETLSSKHNDDKLTLIKYASFYGSIQIFNYLFKNCTTLTPSLLLYAIHSQNTEIINILEKGLFKLQKGKKTLLNNKIEEELYYECFKESIKCFHNDIAFYIQSNHLKNEKDFLYETFNQSLKSYNFVFIKNELINESSFNDICRYDYSLLACIIMADTNVDVNKVDIKI